MDDEYDEYNVFDYYSRVWESDWQRDETLEAQVCVVRDDEGFHTMLIVGDDDRDYVSAETYATEEDAIEAARQELADFFARRSPDLEARQEAEIAAYENRKRNIDLSR